MAQIMRYSHITVSLVTRTYQEMR